MLAERVKQVGRAWREGDVDAVRTELAVLGAEAILLSKMHPLPIGDPLTARQRIASERSPSSRGATS